MMAVVQLRNATAGRAYYDRKVAAGKSSQRGHALPQTKALRHCLPAPCSTTSSLLARARRGRVREDTGEAYSDSSAAGSHPHTSSSDKSLPGPATTKPRTPLRKAS